MKHRKSNIPSITYWVKMLCQDHHGRDYDAHLFVGNDLPLTLDNIAHVVDLWVRDKIDGKAKTVLSFRLLDTLKT